MAIRDNSVCTPRRRRLAGDSEPHKTSQLETKSAKIYTRLLSLCADFKRATEIAAFGRHSTDTSLRIVNSLGMSIVDYMIRKAYPDRNRVVAEIDGQDVSSAVYEELCCVSKWLEKVQSLRWQVESAFDEPFGETVQDPTYIPEESDGSETGEEGDEYEKTGPSTSAKQPGKPISIKLNFSRKSKKRPKAETAEASDTASSPSKKKKMTPQSVMEPQTVGPPDATSTSHTTPATQSKCRSHHKKSKCIYCSKEVFDLKRHLRMHAKNDEIEEVDVERSFHVAVKSTRRRGPQRPGKRPGIPLKWCPVPDCSFVTAHMRKHLANKHRIKAGAYFEGLIQVARLYAGKSELEDLPQIKPKKELEGSLTTSETTVNSQDSYTEQYQVMNTEPEGQDLESSQPPSDPEDNSDDEDYEEFQPQEEYFTSATP